MTQADKLLRLKKEIDDAKLKIAELNGKRETVTDELKNDWQCTTLKQAEKKVTDLGNNVEEFSKQIQQGMESLEEKYEL